MARYLNDGTSVFALQHRFRDIKKDAAVMKAGIWHLISRNLVANIRSPFALITSAHMPWISFRHFPFVVSVTTAVVKSLKEY